MLKLMKQKFIVNIEDQYGYSLVFIVNVLDDFLH